jgi:hypothetical protein
MGSLLANLAEQVKTKDESKVDSEGKNNQDAESKISEVGTRAIGSDGGGYGCSKSNRSATGFGKAETGTRGLCKQKDETRAGADDLSILLMPGMLPLEGANPTNSLRSREASCRATNASRVGFAATTWEVWCLGACPPPETVTPWLIYAICHVSSSSLSWSGWVSVHSIGYTSPSYPYAAASWFSDAPYVEVNGPVETFVGLGGRCIRFIWRDGYGKFHLDTQQAEVRHHP